MRDDVLKIIALPQEKNEQYLEKTKLIEEIRRTQFAITRLKKFITNLKNAQITELQEDTDKTEKKSSKPLRDADVSELQYTLIILTKLKGINRQLQ